jgi:hypothetical protein
MIDVTDDQATQQLEQDYLALAAMWFELIDKVDNGSWLLAENEALNNTERLFDDVH